MRVTRADGLIDAQQAAMMCRVRPRTIHQWVSRGHLAKAGIGERTAPSGRVYKVSLFDPVAVARCEAALRKDARRIILPLSA